MRGAVCPLLALLQGLTLLSLLTLALQLTVLTHSAEALDPAQMCGLPSTYRSTPWIQPPNTTRPTPALAAHAADAFSLYPCSLTFAQHEEAYRDWAACYHSVRMNVVTCPRHCLQAVSLSPLNATVLRLLALPR